MITACDSVTLTTIDARCETSIGGVKAIYIINKDDVTGITYNSDNEITGISLATSAHWNKWEFRRNTGSYTSTVEVDIAIGNASCTTEVVLQFTKAEAIKRLAIQNAINANACVIVESVSGERIFLGMDNPVNITNVTMQSGTANTDLNGFNLTFSDTSKELPYFLGSSVVIVTA